VMPPMRQQAARTATELVREDPRTAVVLAEISTDLFHDATAHDPTRVVNVGIMEQTMVGVAAGMAMEGFRPIVHTITPFLVDRPFEQVKLDFGYQGLAGTFVSTGGANDYTGEGFTHHSPGDVQAMLTIPGMQVVVPGSGPEVAVLLRAAHGSGGSTYLRTSIRSNDSAREVAFGRNEIVRRGRRATIVAIGPMLDRTLEAVRDMDVTVVSVTTVQPFDGSTLRAVAGDAPLVVAVEPFFEGTMAPLLAEALADRPARFRSVGIPRSILRAYGEPADHDRELGLDVAGIRRRLSSID
jgi:transketolase